MSRKKFIKRYRTIARFVEGNAVGIVEQLIVPAGVRRSDVAQRRDFRMVRIGVIDSVRAQREPFPVVEYGIVIEKLRVYVKSLMAA